MAITAGMVKELREMTGAGMMDCKKALTETNGDIDKAVEFLREKGLAAAEKKAGRIAAEGIVSAIISEDEKSAAIVEVNSETDFVAKNENFRNYVDAVVKQVLTSSSTDVNEFLEEKWDLDNSKTVKEELSTQISIIGENMSIRRYERISTTDGFVTSYIHGGGRIGILIEVATSVNNEQTQEAAKNVAMQVAAMSPKYIKREDIAEDFINHEKDIIKAQIMNDPDASKKPENIIEKMMVGRLNKELKEICLLDQVYVKDGDFTVAKYLDSVAKEVGATIEIKKFVRFETGEGLAKREEDFAEEVAKQMGN